MAKSAIIGILGVLLLWSVPANMGLAAERLEDLLAEVLVRHPLIRIRDSEARAAEAELDAARWGRFPTISVNAETGEDGDPQLVARAEQPLWAGGRISGRIEASTARKSGADAATEQVKLDLLRRTADTFFEILRLEGRREAAVGNEAELQDLLALIRRRVEARINPAADELLARNRLSQARNERLAIQRELSIARTRLAKLVNRPVAELAEPQEIAIADRSRDMLETAALDYAPERRRILAMIDESRANKTLAAADALPTVVVGYQHRLGDREFADQERGRVYMALRMETGAGLSSLAVTRAARARILAAEAELRNHERELSLMVESMWEEAMSWERQLEPARDMLEGSTQMVESYLRQFQVGKKSWLDVLNVHREKFQAELSLADVKHSLNKARFHLILLSGRLTPQDLEQHHDG